MNPSCSPFLAPRRRTRQIRVGSVPVGGDAPIAVQSMTSTDTRDVDATVAQIHRLEEAGCEIVRVAVPDADAARALGRIKARIGIPLVADIHFHHRLALEAIRQGVDGLRLNPGNIGDRDRVAAVVREAKAAGIPIRVGVNAGSLEEDLLARYGFPTPEALVESALRHVRLLEDLGLDAIKVSLKASDVGLTVAAYRRFSELSDWPLHLGVTEAGTPLPGTVKSALGLGLLLAQGIGDTVRVSLTADPVEEVRVAYEILKALRLRHRGVNVIACPTCGRLEIDLEKLAREVESRLAHVREPLTVAVLGCVVNGIGEAREADLGIAGGKGVGLLFRNGQVLRKVREPELADALVREVEAVVAERRAAVPHAS